IGVNTGALSLCLIPALGGKINSLRDLRTGREWLWRNPRLPYRRAEPESAYVAVADTGGWDECFPTVAPCAYPSAPWAGAAVPVKLWSAPLAEGQGWATVQASDGALHMRWDPALLPQVGFWLNLGAWSGDGGAPYYNLGLEPCLGAQDSLAEAVTRQHVFGE